MPWLSGVLLDMEKAIANAEGQIVGDVTYTVGMYSPGKAFVVYEMSRHV